MVPLYDALGDRSSTQTIKRGAKMPSKPQKSKQSAARWHRLPTQHCTRLHAHTHTNLLRPRGLARSELIREQQTLAKCLDRMVHAPGHLAHGRVYIKQEQPKLEPSC